MKLPNNPRPKFPYGRMIFFLLLTWGAVALIYADRHYELSQLLSNGASVCWMLGIIFVVFGISLRRLTRTAFRKEEKLTPIHQKNREQFLKFFDAHQSLYDVINSERYQDKILVQIHYADQGGKILAEALATFFRMMGYDMDDPLTLQNLTHIQGIEVHGNNIALVNGVTNALRQAWLTETQPVIDPDEQENMHNTLRIVIGRCP